MIILLLIVLFVFFCFLPGLLKRDVFYKIKRKILNSDFVFTFFDYVYYKNEEKLYKPRKFRLKLATYLNIKGFTLISRFFRGTLGKNDIRNYFKRTYKIILKRCIVIFFIINIFGCFYSVYLGEQNKQAFKNHQKTKSALNYLYKTTNFNPNK